MLAALLLPILVFSFLTVDIPYRGFDHFFSMAAAKPGNWLSVGYFVMAAGAPLIVLIARRFGGEEASRVVTLAWAAAAFAAFAGVSYLSPELEQGDMPGVAFVAAFDGEAGEQNGRDAEAAPSDCYSPQRITDRRNNEQE